MSIWNKPTKYIASAFLSGCQILNGFFFFTAQSVCNWSLVILLCLYASVWQLHCRIFTFSKTKPKSCSNKIKIPLSRKCKHHKPIPVCKILTRYTISKSSKKSDLNYLFVPFHSYRCNLPPSNVLFSSSTFLYRCNLNHKSPGFEMFLPLMSRLLTSSFLPLFYYSFHFTLCIC